MVGRDICHTGCFYKSTAIWRIAAEFSAHLRFPPSQNFTDTGFKKVRAPDAIFQLLKDFWEKNKDSQVEEDWGSGDMTVNSWESMTYMVNLEDTSLQGSGMRIKRPIWEGVEQSLREWTGQELRGCSLYGIRVYRTGAILSPHVDRFPLVSSAIINVAQDLDEPWPLEVYGRNGMAVNVTMEPGDMVRFASYSRGRTSRAFARDYVILARVWEKSSPPVSFPIPASECLVPAPLKPRCEHDNRNLNEQRKDAGVPYAIS